MPSEAEPVTWTELEASRVRRGLTTGCYVGMVIFSAFSLVDYLVYPDHFVAFLYLRLLSAAGTLPVLLIIPYATRRWHRTALGAALCLWITSIICVMLTMTGYESSLYYVGIIVVILGMGLLLPWSWADTLIVGLGMAAAFNVVVALDPKPNARAAINNTFFLLGALGISMAGNVQSMRQRRSAFEAQENLAKAYDKLRDLDRMKSNFMANISHEMRTPLTLMLGALESLMSAPTSSLGSHRLEYLEVIRRNGLSLLRLINDLLDLARLESAQERLRLEDFDLADLIRGVTSQAKPMLAWRSLELELDLPDAPLRVTLDPLKIEKVALNLLSNAIKFTPKGGRIRVAIELEEGKVRLVVTDTGIGIPAEAHERIFERFSQLDAGSTRQRGGTGIGLALVKEFVELHRGSVTVTSATGQGSTFTVTLPTDTKVIPEERIDRRILQVETGMARRQEDAGLGEWIRRLSESPEYRFGGLYEVADRRTADRIEGGPRAGTVLLVEDSRDLIRFLSLQLSPEYRVVTASDGVEGWERTRAELPDVVVTDLMMPRRDGQWLCRQIRADLATHNIPIILLTARGQTEDRVQAREGGADVYLTKPFSVRELLAAIGTLMKRKRERVDSLTQETASSLKVLTAGLAHELLNPLGFISNALFALEETIQDLVAPAPGAGSASAEPPQPPAKEAERCRRLLKSARVGLDRIQTLVGELKSVSRPGVDAPPEPADVNQAIRSTLLLVGANSNLNLQVHLDLCEDAAIPCRIGRINQVLLNLVKNALHALPNGTGDVWIQTRRRTDTLEVSVGDNGCGIPPENLERVFDPFFTTRAPGEGSGLGLPLCRKIVEEHGGTLTLSSIVGEGTRILISLPATGTVAEQTPELLPIQGSLGV